MEGTIALLNMAKTRSYLKLKLCGIPTSYKIFIEVGSLTVAIVLIFRQISDSVTVLDNN